MKLLVYNDKVYSGTFSTKLGLKQGGSASPKLFSLYLEELTDTLNSSGIGIKIGKLIINHFMYADDVILIANNTADLNKMLKITGEYGELKEIKFNPGKHNT